MSTYQVQAPFTLQYYAQWRSVLSMKSIRREPIEPPEGYEHVSMEPYPSSNDAPSGVEESPEEEPSMLAERPEPENEPPLNPQENQNADDTSSVWPYVLVAAALIGIAVIILRSRKGKSER